MAQRLDADNPLKDHRSRFHHPKLNGKPATYFCGNSLGLEPKTAKEFVNQELDDWAEFAVEGHFHAKTPWFSYQDVFPEPLSQVVGALPKEVTVMNGLTVNLHLLMVSFYVPKGKHYKIICEAKASPSDHCALESQVRFLGYEPAEAWPDRVWIHSETI